MPGPAPRPLFCVVSEAHADVQAARAACDGNFCECGRSFTLGLPPNWHADPLPADPEWRIAWHKLYVGLDLAHAYEQTRDAIYLETWRSLVCSFAEQIEPGGGLQDCHVVARRVLNVLYAWDRFTRAGPGPALDDDAGSMLLRHLGGEVRYIREHLTAELNHRTIELTALVLAALAFPQLDADGALMSFALAELEHSARSDLHADGVHVEASTHYHALFVRNFMAVRVNLARQGIAVSPEFDALLRRAARFLLHLTRPDGTIGAFSDGDNASYVDVLALAAEAFDCAELRWFASHGREGQVPPCAADFPDGGYFVQRSHWTDAPEPAADARHLVWDCGPVGRGVHGHYDMLHFELAAGGRPLIVDPGRYTYAEGEPNWRHHFKATAAHNTVTVDGLDQCDYYPWNIGVPPPRVAAARLVGRWLDAGLDVLVGEVTSPRYDALHRRMIALIGGRWWLLVDVLEAASRHRYDQRFQLTPAAHSAVTCSSIGAGTLVASPGLELVCLGDGQVEIEQGWVAPKYGIKHAAPRVRRSLDGASVAMVSLLVPRLEPDAGHPAPVELREWALDGAGGRVGVIVDGIETRVSWRAPPTLAGHNPVALG